MNLSIVIPLLNEEDSLEELFQELIKSAKPVIYLTKSGLWMMEVRIYRGALLRT